MLPGTAESLINLYKRPVSSKNLFWARAMTANLMIVSEKSILTKKCDIFLLYIVNNAFSVYNTMYCK